MPNPRTVIDTVAVKYSDNEILQRVAERLDDGSMAWKVDIVGGLSVSVGDINIGAVNILNASDAQINPATEETLAAILTAISGGADLATDTTLAGFRADVAARDLATETTLAGFRADLAARDLATETTLALFKSAFDTRDLATETTLALLKERADLLATEATLATRLADTTFTGRINTLGQKDMAASTPVVIASDQSAIPASQNGIWTVRLADGAGALLTSTLVNTRQALDIHQVDTSFVVSGLTAVGNAPSLNPLSVAGIDGGGLKRHIRTDASGRIAHAFTVVSAPAAYTPGTIDAVTGDRFGNTRVSVDAAGAQSALESIANRLYHIVYEGLVNTAEVDVLLIRNPTGSARKVHIKRVVNSTPSAKSATSRLYHTPTITANGTTITPVSLHIGGGAPAAVTLATSLPTISARGTPVSTRSLLNEPSENNWDWGLILEPNTAILITMQGGGNNTSFALNITISEVP